MTVLREFDFSDADIWFVRFALDRDLAKIAIGEYYFNLALCFSSVLNPQPYARLIQVISRVAYICTILTMVEKVLVVN